MPRGTFPVTPAGRSSSRAQPILHYERKRVLHSARKSGLHYEQREFFSTPHRTNAPLYVTRVLTHARWRGYRGSHTSWGMCPGGKPPVYSIPPRHPAGLSSCRGLRRGEFPSVTPAGRSSPWAQPILHYEQREFFSTPHHTYTPLYAAPLPRGRKFPRDIRVRVFFIMEHKCLASLAQNC